MSSGAVLDSASEYTVAWIAALAHERAAARQMLDEIHDTPKAFVQHASDQNSYTWGRIGEHNVVLLSLPGGEHGLVSAADAASSLRASLPDIRVGLLVGIGGGLQDREEASKLKDGKKILLGDVVVSSPEGREAGIVQYDFFKAKKEGGKSVRELKGFLNAAPRHLRAAVSHLISEHESDDPRFLDYLKVFKLNQRMKDKYSYQEKEDGSPLDPHRDSTTRRWPEVHYGTIASSNVRMKDDDDRKEMLEWLKQYDIEPKCVEMEAAGLMNSFPCLVICGVCDYANKQTDDLWQGYAAATAAAYAKELLEYVAVSKVQKTARIAEVLDNSQEHFGRSSHAPLSDLFQVQAAGGEDFVRVPSMNDLGTLRLSDFVLDATQIGDETPRFEAEMVYKPHRQFCSTTGGHKVLVLRTACIGQIIAAIEVGKTPYVVDPCKNDIAAIRRLLRSKAFQRKSFGKVCRITSSSASVLFLA